MGKKRVNKRRGDNGFRDKINYKPSKKKDPKGKSQHTKGGKKKERFFRRENPKKRGSTGLIGGRRSHS